ncbi:MAG: hypothetical protein KGJ32_02855 [Xanthomonadaceae bacterium]|nr:hypothetical protein [Xanthomonadaceae bacterium]
MSDFLDRLAARALGSETTLTPRLPARFEPRQGSPIMPLPPGEADARQPMHGAPPTNAVAAAIDRSRPQRASAVPGHGEPHIMATPPERVVASLPSGDAVRIPHRDAPPAPAVAAPAASRIHQRSAPPATSPRQPDVLRPAAPVQPRQVRIAPDRAEPATRASTDVPPPLFSPETHALPAAQAAGRSRASRAPRDRPVPSARADDTAGETVVHVSIGRLEVRAAAAAVAAPRRQDGQRPSSLDDYLRQRGDKVPR